MTQLITRAIEPIYHNGDTRTRFKINSLNNGILPRLRLCNISLSDVNNGAAVPDSFYSCTGGAVSLIKRMTLSERGNPIEDLTMRAAEFMAFKNLTNTTQEIEESLRTITIKSRNAMSPVIDNTNKPQRNVPFNNLTSVSEDIDPNSSNSARLDLQQYFSFLDNEDILVGFKDLELVIEWETDTTKIFDNTRGGNYPVDWTIDEPLLVFEEVLDKDLVTEQAMAKRGTYTKFITPELELLTVPAFAVNDVPTTTKLRIQSIKNKKASKLLIATHDNVLGVSASSCLNNSDTQFNEVWQIYVNNATLFLNPVSTPSRKLATLEDSFGTGLFTWFQIRRNYQNNAGNINDADLTGLETGRLSYFGCDINDIVTDLRLELTRTRIAGVGGAQLGLNCFTFVEKYCIYSESGEVTISYRV